MSQVPPPGPPPPQGQAGPHVQQVYPPPYPPGQVPLGYAGAPPGWAQPTDIGQHAGIRMLLPVGRSGWAIAAGYLGLFSVLLIFAPLALICGIIAIIDMRRHPHRHGMGRAIFGIVMGAIFTLALIAAIIAAVAE